MLNLQSPGNWTQDSAPPPSSMVFWVLILYFFWGRILYSSLGGLKFPKSSSLRLPSADVAGTRNWSFIRLKSNFKQEALGQGVCTFIQMYECISCCGWKCVHLIKSLGSSRDGLAVTSTLCFCSEFRSQRPCQAAHNYQQLQLQGIWCALLRPPRALTYMDAHRYT